MTWLFSYVWLWVLISALLGFAITLFAMIGPTGRRATPAVAPTARPEPEPTGERSRHRAAIAAGADPGAAAERTRRRRSYEVDDVEVSDWAAGDSF